ncbi:MAG: hypothetical protein M1818_000329 [Claussenomyces sp. TS43310]|nr:MAG: hypothetical protein M1818_000329 [Claussenomyces sp. TS43310]
MVRNIGYPAGGERNGDMFGRQWHPEERLSDRFMNEAQAPTDMVRSIPHGNPDFLSIEAALNQCGIEHFAIVVSQDGQANEYTSKSLRSAEKSIFSPRVHDIVQRTLYRSSHSAGYAQQGFGHHVSGNAYSDLEADSGEGNRRLSSSTDSSTGRRFSRNCKLESPEDEEPFNARNRKRYRAQMYHPRYSTVPEDDLPLPIPVSHTRQLRIGDAQQVQDFYIQRFKDLQQSACKVIAKAFVKIIEPKKQTNHPYTGGHAKAPGWWPLPTKDGAKDGVRHREPDHLLKPERIKLLVHILSMVIDPTADKPQHMKSITVKKLEDITSEAMSNWFGDKDNIENAAKKPLLKEIFKVAKQEERYKKGEIGLFRVVLVTISMLTRHADDTASVPVSHGDNVGINGSDDEPDDGLKYDDDDGPPAAAIPTPDSLVSPHTSTGQSALHGRPTEHEDPTSFGGYSLRELPVRSFSQHPPPNEDQAYADNQMTMSQGGYLHNRTLYQNPSPILQDQHRRPTWQADSFSTPTQQGLYNNWSSNGPMMSSNMPYSTYAAGPPPQTHQQIPYLPRPTQQSNLLPPMHQSFDNVPGRPYESTPPQLHALRTGSMGHPQHLSQQGNQGFTQYLHEGAYGPADGGMKDDGHLHSN